MTEAHVRQRLAHLGIDLATHLAEHPGGKTPEEIADDVIEAIGAVTPWTLLGPVGVVIDAAEVQVVKGIVHAILRGMARAKHGQRGDGSRS